MNTPAELEFSESPHPRATTRLRARAWVAAMPTELFAFFSEADNLQRLTPARLQFRVTTPSPVVMQDGTQIDYRLKVYGIPLRWKSEIRDWDPPREFVDVQLHGPYRYWHHRHRFEPSDDGTVVIDEVDYSPPGGRIVDRMLVRRELRTSFTYRMEQLAELFPAANRD